MIDCQTACMPLPHYASGKVVHSVKTAWDREGSSATPPKRAGSGGVDRARFYAWKRRFQTRGFDGLRNLPPLHMHHPQKTLLEASSG